MAGGNGKSQKSPALRKAKYPAFEAEMLILPSKVINPQSSVQQQRSNSQKGVCVKRKLLVLQIDSVKASRMFFTINMS